MLIWIRRALLSTAAEIKTLEGREMLVGLISPPVTDWLLHNTSSLARLVRITIVSQRYVLLGSVQFWSAWFEFTIGCFLAPSLGNLSLNYTTLVFVSLISCICQLFRKYVMTKASFFLKLLKTNCDFWSVVTRLRFSCIRAEAFCTWKIGSGKSWQWRPTPGDPWGVEQHHWNTGAKENQQLNPGGSRRRVRPKSDI